jgi:hypothetical protein
MQSIKCFPNKELRKTLLDPARKAQSKKLSTPVWAVLESVTRQDKVPLGKRDLPWPRLLFNGLLFLAFNEFGRLAHEVLGFPIFGPDLLFHDLPKLGKQHLRLLLLA